MTAVEPLIPVTAAPPVPAATGGLARRGALPTVRVNLLPEEVRTARKGRRVRRVVAALLLLQVVVLAGVAVTVRSGVGAANDELAAAEAVNANLRNQQRSYADVVAAQGALEAVDRRLATLTAGDVGWAPLVRALQAAAPAGVVVGGVKGTSAAAEPGATGSAAVAPGAAAAGTAPGAAAAPGATGAAATVVGSLTVAGTAAGPGDVAAYVDALTAVAGLAHVAATSVTVGDEGRFVFQLTADVTAAALAPRGSSGGGR